MFCLCLDGLYSRGAKSNRVSVCSLVKSLLHFCHFSGLLTLVAPLDFEVSREYYLSVEGSRGKSSLSDITTVIINVTDVNDNTPVFGQGGYSAEITEDLTPGALVMKVRGGVKVFVFIASHSADGTEKKQREH